MAEGPCQWRWAVAVGWEFLQSFLPYTKHGDLAAAWFAKARKDMASMWLL